MVAAEQRIWTLALAAAAVGSGIVGRFLFGPAADGLLFWSLYAVGVAVLAIPLVLGEIALGQARQRDAVGTFGPGAWSGLGWTAVVASLLLAAFLALLGGWSARMAFDSFGGDYFDDPDRHVRLITQGLDALLWALGVLAAACALAWRAARRGLHGPIKAVAVLAGLAAAAILVYGLLSGNGADRDAARAFPWQDLSGTLLVEAAQQALIPAFVGFGLVATLSAKTTNRALPEALVPLGIFWLAIPLAIGMGLSALGHAHGAGFDDGIGLGGLANLAATIGGTAGGLLAGTLFGLLLLGCLIALVAILEVPATVLVERWAWPETKANLALVLTTYLLVVPLAFVQDLAFDLELIFAAVLAPLAGLAVALLVGWFRPSILDGLRLGDDGPALAGAGRIFLRFIVPAPLALLALIGAMEVAVHVFGASAGSTGLWKLVP